jgi:hypothetical protein
VRHRNAPIQAVSICGHWSGLVCSGAVRTSTFGAPAALSFILPSSSKAQPGRTGGTGPKPALTGTRFHSGTSTGSHLPRGLTDIVRGGTGMAASNHPTDTTGMTRHEASTQPGGWSASERSPAAPPSRWSTRPCGPRDPDGASRSQDAPSVSPPASPRVTVSGTHPTASGGAPQPLAACRGRQSSGASPGPLVAGGQHVTGPVIGTGVVRTGWTTNMVLDEYYSDPAGCRSQLGPGPRTSRGTSQ